MEAVADDVVPKIRERFSQQWPLGNVSALAIEGEPGDFDRPYQIEAFVKPAIQWIDYLRPMPGGRFGFDPSSGWDVRFSSTDITALDRFIATAALAGKTLGNLLEAQIGLEPCFAKNPGRLWVRAVFLAGMRGDLGVDGLKEHLWFSPASPKIAYGRRYVARHGDEIEPSLTHQLMLIGDIVAASIALLDHLESRPAEPRGGAEAARPKKEKADDLLQKLFQTDPRLCLLSPQNEIAKRVPCSPSTLVDLPFFKANLRPRRKTIETAVAGERSLRRELCQKGLSEEDGQRLEKLTRGLDEYVADVVAEMSRDDTPDETDMSRFDRSGI